LIPTLTNNKYKEQIKESKLTEQANTTRTTTTHTTALPISISLSPSLSHLY